MSSQQVVIFGEVLFDCFLNGKVVLGGAPFNVAWNLQAFGVSPLFISRIGNDSYGEMVKQAMTDWEMSLSGLETDSVYPTGVVTVKFDNNEPQYEIVENSAYDFIEGSVLNQLTDDTILYHGTLALRNQKSATTLNKIKSKISPSIFLDVNLRSPWWNQDKINSSLQDARWLKLNQDELPLIVPQENDLESQIQYLFSCFGLQVIILTKGKNGAVSFQPDGVNHPIAPPPSTQVVDTVGAGDAFSSVLLLGVIKGWRLSETLIKAQEFASAVVGIQGATINDKSFYNSFLKRWSLQ